MQIERAGGAARGRAGVMVAGILAMLATGCRGPERAAHRSEQPVRVVSFSEAASIRAIEVIAPFAFLASERGLGRWNLRTGQVLFLSAEHGLPGDRVDALAYDATREWLWIATDQGVTRYEVRSGAFSELPPPPLVLGLLPIAGVVLAPAGDGGLWIGHERGLFYTNIEGQWTDTPLTEPITALRRTRDGWLWIGTDAGLMGLRPDGETFHYGLELGCDLKAVRLLVEAPGGVPLVVGENEDGQQRIVTIRDGRCASFRAAPDLRWLSVSSWGDELMILTPERVYTLAVAGTGPADLSRNGMRLLPVRLAGGKEASPSPYVLRARNELTLPPGAHLLAAAEKELLVGTRSLGAARVFLDTPPPGAERWLRRSELVEDAIALTVACAKPDDCYVGTGRHGWHFDGEGFTRVKRPNGRVLAFARSAEGERYAVVRGESEGRLLVERIDEGGWVQVTGVAIETPGNFPSVSFARFSPGGKLWLGLRYRDDDGDWMPYGAAEIAVSLGLVTYHGARVRKQHRRDKGLRIPMSLADVAFFEDDEVWLASTEGAVQIRGRKITVHGESQGLEAQMLGGVAVAPGGVVFAASRAGVVSYDGASWTYPEPLRSPVSDIEVGADGRLWMATRRGLGVFDGASVRWFDERRGLLENQVEEAVADSLGRIWVRSARGLSLLTP